MFLIWVPPISKTFLTTCPPTLGGLPCLGRPFSRPPPRVRPAAMCLPARLLAVMLCLCCVVLCCVLGRLLSLASVTGLTPCLLRCCCMLLHAVARFRRVWMCFRRLLATGYRSNGLPASLPLHAGALLPLLCCVVFAVLNQCCCDAPFRGCRPSPTTVR